MIVHRRPRRHLYRGHRNVARLFGWSAMAAVLICGWAFQPSLGWSQNGNGEEKPLPGRVVIDIDAPQRDLYKIAIPDLLGPKGGQGAEVIRNDLHLVSLFNVLDEKSFLADLEAEGLSIEPKSWLPVGAQGIVKGKLSGSGSRMSADMRLYEPARGTDPLLEKRYRGKLRDIMHEFANDVLEVLTGEEGSFDTKLTFARRIGPGRKNIYVSDFDGDNVHRVSPGSGVEMLPNFGKGGVWYSVLRPRGMFITRTGTGGEPIVRGSGLNMGAAPCNGRLYFTSTRHGNSEIYSSAFDGSGVRRLTRHAGIDVSPACGPGGKIAFVSTRHGGPQIFVMNGDGSGVKRVTYRGDHNQTPAWCPRGDKQIIAFTGRSEGLDIFTVDLQTGEYKRLTQGQGSNKDPAFSPDCRMVAFASSRGGIYISSHEGLNQNRVVAGAAETVRWSRN